MKDKLWNYMPSESAIKYYKSVWGQSWQMDERFIGIDPAKVNVAQSSQTLSSEGSLIINGFAG